MTGALKLYNTKVVIDRKPDKPSKTLSTNFAPACKLHVRNLHATYVTGVRRGNNDPSMPQSAYSDVYCLLGALEHFIASGKYDNLPEYV